MNPMYHLQSTFLLSTVTVAIAPHTVVSAETRNGATRRRTPMSSAGLRPVSMYGTPPVPTGASRYSTSASYGFAPNNGIAATAQMVTASVLQQVFATFIVIILSFFVLLVMSVR